MLILLMSPSMKWSHGERKLELVVILSLLVLSLLSCCKCQKEVCGTRASEAIDVMWMTHSNHDVKSADFLILKQFLSDMMLWFRISSSNTNGTRHGCLIYSDTVQEVSNYETSVNKAQKNFIGLKQENSTDNWFDKAFNYLVRNSVSLDRETVPNIAVVVTYGEPSPTDRASTAAAELTKAGWTIIFLVVTSKVDRSKMQIISSKLQLSAKNYYTVGSYSELNSLEFQEQFARAVCGHDNYIEETKVRLRSNSYLEETKVRLRSNSYLEETKVKLRRNSEVNETKVGQKSTSAVEYGYVNVAEKKPAKQSSIFVNIDVTPNLYYTASLAVDGISNPILIEGSCSWTKDEQVENFWEVDLNKTHDVEYVSLMNMQIKDDLWKQMSFEVIGHTGYNGDNPTPVNPQLCGTRDKTPLAISALFKCITMLEQKRYIRIQQTEVYNNNNMGFCEVQVWTAWPPGYFNVAVNKPSTVRMAGSGSPEVAVDGNTNPIFRDGSCFLTEGKTTVKEWWQVDLEQLYDIVGITLFNRRDDFLLMRYANVIAYKEPSGAERLGSETCGTILGGVYFSLRHFKCELPQKRYILIEQSRASTENFLILCEVEVWTECEVGTYGRYCKQKCGNCGGNGACDKVTGACVSPEAQTTSSNSGAIAGAVVGVLLIAAAGASVGGLFYYRRTHKKEEPETVTETQETKEEEVDVPITTQVENWLFEKDEPAAPTED